MQATNATYDSIIENAIDSLKVEYRITVNNTSPAYEQDELISGMITEVLYSKFSIGNLLAKTFEFSFIPRNVEVPKGASIFVEYRISDGVTWSSWMPKGTFFIDRRKTNHGVTHVVAYDAAIKANAVFMKAGDWQNISALALYGELRGLLGLAEDSSTASTINAMNYPITKAPSIGEEGTTILEMLNWLGALYGGNWTVTEDSKLKLIPINPSAYNEYKTDEDIEFANSASTVDRLVVYIDAGGEAYLRYPNVGWDEWNAMTGYVIECDCPYATETNIVNIYNAVHNATYRGFSSVYVSEDPALQIGDGVELEGVECILVKRIVEFGVDFAEMSAPFEEELESEFPTVTPQIRKLRRSVEATGVSLSVLDNRIESEVKTFNEKLGVNIAELTAHNPADVYNASTNPNAYWMSSIATPVNVIGGWVTQLDNGWYHIEGVSTTSSPKCIRFEPKAIASLDADTLTLLMEIKNASYTGTIGFASAQLASTGMLVRQYTINASYSDCQNPTDGKYYFTLNKNTSEQVKKALFAFGTDTISQGEGMNLDIRLSLYVGAYDGDYVPWSANSYNSRVQQTADGILISLTKKITEEDAQNLVDAYGQVIEQYLRFANGILELGESNSQFKALLSNVKLSFTGADGREVAWISNSQLFISQAVLNGSLTMRANEYATTSWMHYVRESDNIYCIKVVKPNA